MDSNFHYYGTYLAACLAGMAPDRAQQLAYYCRTMIQMQAGSDDLSTWHYQDHTFNPCIAGYDLIQSEDPCYLNISFHCNLAFKHLPALDQIEIKRTPKNTILKSFINKTETNNSAIKSSAMAVTKTSHYYNPLTDIDWQQGGKFKTQFSQKLALKHAAYQNKDDQGKEQHKESNFTHSFVHPNLETQVENQDRSKIDLKLNPNLISKANSDFSRSMLNDVIYKNRYSSDINKFSLALFGSRLFIYQNTWCQKHQKHNLLDAFFWSVYAINCFIKGKFITNKRHWSVPLTFNKNNELENSLTEIFNLKGQHLQTEYVWLKHITKLLSDESCDHNSREGLRYRENYLVEQAMLAVDTNDARKIHSLTKFKSSHFFKLNKANEYHSTWLAQQFKNHNLHGIDPTQTLGNNNIWQ